VNNITDGQLEEYRNYGFLLQSSVFSQKEIQLLKSAAEAEFSIASPRKTVEPSSGAVRAVHGGHLHNEQLSRLVRSPQLLPPARVLLGEDVYVYQFKINAKVAFKGEIWDWHQDYIFWRNEDGMPAPRAITVALFLDDVTEFNGPLIFVPGAHIADMIEVEASSDGWENTLSTDLKYSLSPEVITNLVVKHGLIAPKGPAGSLLWFDCNIPHGSAPNMSPFDRNLILITYNAVGNAPVSASPRPEWLVERDPTPLLPWR
jgi:ectoine hydroxylase